MEISTIFGMAIFLNHFSEGSLRIFVHWKKFLSIQYEVKPSIEKEFG